MSVNNHETHKKIFQGWSIMGKKIKETVTHRGGWRRRPTAGSWHGSFRPPREDTWCWPFGTGDGWTTPPWCLKLYTLGGPRERERESEWERREVKDERLYEVSKWNMWVENMQLCIDAACYSQSAFFKDCFFLEGLEMTLILLLRNTPMLALLPYNIFTDSMKCFLLSESLMYSVLAVQKC